MISEEQLTKWEKLCNDATPWPWNCCDKDADYAVLSGNINKKNSIIICHSEYKKDMMFCAEARSAVPALIAEVRRLRAEVDKVSDERSDFGVIGYFQGSSDARDRVRQLKNKINKLVAMVDYLAQQCAGLTYELYAEKAVDFYDSPEVKPAYWRQEAHEAANNDG